MHLTEKQLKIIAEVASQQAVKAYKADLEKVEEVRHDRRLRNIRLLLKNYRALMIHAEKLKDDIDDFEETSIHQLNVYTVSLESIESIMKSQKKTIAMTQFIKDKVEAYKNSCSKEELKYYQVLEMKYISSKKYTHQEIADRMHVDRTTVSRYLTRAVEDLLVIVFGVEALHFEK
ncbi:hypothetical protein MUB24_03360 [Lederbergia sp. NSJ-179]|uniref:sigma factor-like helix-turn-helix DNA-binding protein n=1 Tax=Lederbergia sp. NSJ-179 TaxID=2931402 RepID=UPI001FD2643B|nr:sigma factor-like helix-turn-helix DNA-binding protein [Lederbergia sp. NSJ-179]MCJ7839965.1 hypothetical protein [Lederbergia sp. NSJ-179]